MKRSAILLCALAALCAAGMAAAHALVMDTGNKVVFRETALFGDAAAAEGLTLTVQQTCAGQLFWDSTLPLAAPERAQTVFTAQSRPADTEPYPPQGPMLYPALYEITRNYDDGASPDKLRRELPFMYDQGLGRVFLDLILAVADRTEASGTHEETVPVRSYLEYIPLWVSFDFGSGVILRYQDLPYNVPFGDLTPLINQFNDTFRFPVSEDATVTVAVRKNAKGLVTWLEITWNGESPEIWTNSVFTEGKCWFTLSASCGGEPLDLSAVRLGSGLYCLPFSESEASPDGRFVDIDLDTLHTALPFAEDETPVSLYDGGDGTLLILLRTSAGLDLVVLDTATEQAVQRLTLFRSDELRGAEADGGICLAPLDGSLYTSCATRVRYYGRGTDGRCALLLDVPNGIVQAARDAYPTLSFYDPAAAAWDGERLAVVVNGSMGYDGTFLAAVFDASGLRYCAALQSRIMPRVPPVGLNGSVRYGLPRADTVRSGGFAIAFSGK